jgi:HD superfamily phosphohydrolase
VTGVEFEIIRDPLWNNIRVDPVAMQLVDTAAFQRLRYVKQLGLAHLVYPGALHSRFEHALGTYHLAGRTLALLAERNELTEISSAEQRVVRYAALLHDVGHYPFSHALEEMGAIHHEDVAGPLLTNGAVADVLTAALGEDAPEAVHRLVVGSSDSALQGLISGSLDLDKIEYLKRDAFMCGVPYGEIDVDRLTNSMVILRDPLTAVSAIGVAEKALSALESLLFAKYQMYRNVYWHHAVRSATAMYKRLVDDALRSGSLDAECLHSYTDEGLLHQVEKTRHPLLADLRARRLYKRAFECPSTEIDAAALDNFLEDRDRVRAAEDRLAAASGLRRGQLLVDFPAKTEMLGLDILVVRRNGDVQRLTATGWREAINLPRLADELYRSTRWLRVYTRERTTLDSHAVLSALSLS